jgi:protein NRD1
MAALEELTTTLQSLSALKPPGVTPTKVKTITQICVDNIQVCGQRSASLSTPHAQDFTKARSHL